MNLLCKMGVHYWSHPGGRCTECDHPDLFGRVGWLEEYQGTCTVVGEGFEADPGWVGPLRRLRARWWASRNCIQLVEGPGT